MRCRGRPELGDSGYVNHENNRNQNSHQGLGCADQRGEFKALDSLSFAFIVCIAHPKQQFGECCVVPARHE